MDFRPCLRIQPSSSDLTLQPSPEACWLKTPERVREEATARVLQAGGDPACLELVLSESELQFGQYRGWLLSHDVGYACSPLASHQKEREGGDTSESPLT
ncbi:unnamed protein product [Lota lota]